MKRLREKKSVVSSLIAKDHSISRYSGCPSANKPRYWVRNVLCRAPRPRGKPFNFYIQPTRCFNPLETVSAPLSRLAVGNRACRKAQRLILLKRTFSGSASRAVRQYLLKRRARARGLTRQPRFECTARPWIVRDAWSISA